MCERGLACLFGEWAADALARGQWRERENAVDLVSVTWDRRKTKRCTFVWKRVRLARERAMEKREKREKTRESLKFVEPSELSEPGRRGCAQQMCILHTSTALYLDTASPEQCCRSKDRAHAALSDFQLTVKAQTVPVSYAPLCTLSIGSGVHLLQYTPSKLLCPSDGSRSTHNERQAVPFPFGAVTSKPFKEKFIPWHVSVVEHS